MTTALTEQELAYLAQVYALEARTHDPTSPAAQRAAMIVRLVDEVRIHRGASDEEREPLREPLRAVVVGSGR